MDIVDKKTRSRMMSGIKAKDTRPEVQVRKSLHSLGFRYRLHDKKLVGKPDLVFPRYKAIILVNGCFWHQHGCHLFKWPATRKAFWREKIMSNVERDYRNLDIYHQANWRVLIIWECALKGKQRRNVEEVVHTAANWIQFDESSAEICGYPLVG